MRLIDADALEKQMRRTSPPMANLPMLRAMPTVDAVEVVRCGDCKHFNPDDQAAQDAEWSGWCRYNGCLTDDFDFCSRGEGRDNETD